MDRPTTRTEADARSPDLDPHGAFLLPSRGPALELCRASIGAGPILVTGDAGVGKTWLWRRLAAESPGSCRWLGVDLTPADGPADLYRLIGRELGLTEPGASGAGRVEIADYLAERRVDGDRRALVVEEAHNVSPAVWEEVRVLANRLDRADGFAALLLVGQTALARRFSARPLASIEARLAARVHLGPIDADEALVLLAHLRPGRDWTREEAEAIHRDSAGNPRRMLRRTPPPPRPAPVAAVARPIAAPMSTPTPAIAHTPAPGQPRPPLRSEENLIEVGWSPDDAADPAGSDQAPGFRAAGVPRAESGEEAVHDHYAALQAWREWAENQGRRGEVASDRALADEIDEGSHAEANDELAVPPPLADRATVWADGQESFAPFSQLFSRMAQSQPRARDPE